MKKLIGILCVFALLAGCVSPSLREGRSLVNKSTIANEADKITVYYGSEKIDEMTVDQFEYLVIHSRYYKELLEAEKNGRVVVVLKDNPWKLDLSGSEFTTEMYIFWKNKDGSSIKKTTLKVTLDIPKEGKKMSKFRILWRNISEVGFPVTTGLLILGLVIMSILM